MSVSAQEESRAELTSFIHQRIAELVVERRKWQRMHALHTIHAPNRRSSAQPDTMARERIDELGLDLKRWRHLFELATTPLEQAEAAPSFVSAASVEYALEAAGAKYGVSRDQILSRTRAKKPTMARLAAIRLVREFTPMSLKEIGRAFGQRDHSTISSACKTTKDWDLDDLRVQFRKWQARRTGPVTTVAYKLPVAYHRAVRSNDKEGWPLAPEAWVGGAHVSKPTDRHIP